MIRRGKALCASFGALLASGVALTAPAFAETDPFNGRMIAALSGTWRIPDGRDAVFLMQADDGMADLVLMRHDAVRGLQPSLYLPALVFAGPMAGQSPSLSPVSDSSFAIKTEQIGVGRTPWYQTLTVAYRDGAYMLAGFTYSFYDRLDLSHTGSCDVNLLTGHYMAELGPGEETTRIERTGTDGPRAFPLAELTDSYFPDPCKLLWTTP